MCIESLQMNAKNVTIMLVCFIFGGIGNWVDGELRSKRIISFYVYSKVFDL